jgi:arylsulfatase A-like enzyme
MFMNLSRPSKYFLLSLLLFIAACKDEVKKDDRPNIVLIIADDMGIGSLSCYNSNTGNHTPNIDRLALNGWRFDQFYVTSPVCSPSRVSILTGLSPQLVEIEKVLKPDRADEQLGFLSSHKTFAEDLKASGYQTAFVGKWHVGYTEKDHPLNNGFGSFAGFLNGHIDYISHQDPNGKFQLMKGHEIWDDAPNKHLTEVLTDEAIRVVEEKNAAPLFLMLSYANPHVPILLPGEKALFPGNGSPREDTPERYKKLVTFLDEEVGKLISAIEKKRGNSLVIFISDQGSPQSVGGNDPYLGGKGTLLEGGLKIPAIFYWPGILTPRRIRTFSTSMDLYFTLLSAAGIKRKPEPGQSGQSLIGQEKLIEDRPFLWEYNGVRAWRKGDWKAVYYCREEGNPRRLQRYLEATPAVPYENWSAGDGKHYLVWLFDLANDSTEKFNRANLQAEKLDEIWKEIGKLSRNQNR